MKEQYLQGGQKEAAQGLETLKPFARPRGQTQTEGGREREREREREAKFHVSSVSEEEMRRRERRGEGMRESQNRIIFHTSRVPPPLCPSFLPSISIALSLSPSLPPLSFLAHLTSPAPAACPLGDLFTVNRETEAERASELHTFLPLSLLRSSSPLSVCPVSVRRN